MNNYIIMLQARIDEAKSANGINTKDLPKLQKQLDKLRLEAAVDENSLRQIAKQLENITGKKLDIFPAGLDAGQAGKDGRKYGEAFQKGASEAIRSHAAGHPSANPVLPSPPDAKTAPSGQNAGSGSRQEAENKTEDTKNSMQGLQRFKAYLKNQLSQAARGFSHLLSLSSVATLVASKTKSAVSDLKEADTLLAEISKADGGLSQADLRGISSSSFEVAARYGGTPAGYLEAVKEAALAGYKDPQGIAELSVAARNAGGMTAELADQYIYAADTAYQLGGSVEKLTKILDGSCSLAGHNAVSMVQLAEGMSAVCSHAASLGVGADEAAAALGTMIAATQRSGAEAAGAFKAILLYLRQVSNEGEGISAEGLAEYEEACRALNVSLKESKKGIASLRSPMEVLRDLAEEYSRLDPGDARRTNLLDSVGGGLRADALDALLENYGLYSKMLGEYAQGAGSMAAEAEKTAQSWEGSLNRLSNTWTKTIGNLVDSNGVKAAVNALNHLLSFIDAVTGKLGSLGTAGLGGGLFAGVKNIGKTYEYTDFINCYLF